MPGCVLRFSGPALDIDDCLARLSLEPDNVFRKGEPRGRIPNAPKNKESGFTVIVSDADGAHVPVQVDEAKTFLESHRGEIRALTSRKDVESAYLDFGWNFPVGENASVAQFNHFTRELISVCAELELGLEVSVYATEVES